MRIKNKKLKPTKPKDTNNDFNDKKKRVRIVMEQKDKDDIKENLINNFVCYCGATIEQAERCVTS